MLSTCKAGACCLALGLLQQDEEAIPVSCHADIVYQILMPVDSDLLLPEQAPSRPEPAFVPNHSTESHRSSATSERERASRQLNPRSEAKIRDQLARNVSSARQENQ